MKKKLSVMLIAAVIILGLGIQAPASAEHQLPRPTSVQPIFFFSLDK